MKERSDLELIIREPNILIEALHKMSKEEMVVWLWTMLNAELDKKEVIASDSGEEIGGSRYRINSQVIKEIKRKKKVPIMVGYTSFKELKRLFPELFDKYKVAYYRKLFTKLGRKGVLEVKLKDYIETLERLGFGYLIDILKIPIDKIGKIRYFEISLAMARFFIDEDNEMMVIFSPYVSPLLLELKSHYTTYDFLQVVKLTKKHSIILFRLFKKRLGLNQSVFKIPFEELQAILNVNYKSYADFNKFVLKPSIEEINTKTAFKVAYEKVRSGNKVVAVRFRILEYNPQAIRDWSKEVLSKEEINSLVRALRLKNKKGEELSLEEVLRELKSFKNLSQAIVMWYLFHFPVETRWYALQTAKSVDANTGLTNHDKFLEKTIPQVQNEKEVAGIKLKELLDERVKVAIKKYFENLKVGGKYSSIDWLSI